MTSSRQRRIKMTTDSQQRSVFTVRPARGIDLLALRQLRAETARLDVPEGIIIGRRPTHLTLESILPGFGRAWTYVLLLDGHIRAYVQARPRRSSPTWDVLYLAYGRKDRVGSSEARDAMWSALLDAVTRTAGRRRATRLFARVPDNADALIALRDAGYIAYGRETLYVAPYHQTARGIADAVPSLHRQQPGDTWAIHQLYTLTTPKAMQFAEARTSGYWDLPKRGGAQAAYWIGEAHEIAAYARTFSGEHTHLVDVLFRPEESAAVVPFIRGVLTALPAGEGDLVYFRALGFQEDLGGMLDTLGFSQLTRQSLLVKYTTISVREVVPAFATIPARTRVVARRVPSVSSVLTFAVRQGRRIVRLARLSHHGNTP